MRSKNDDMLVIVIRPVGGSSFVSCTNVSNGEFIFYLVSHNISASQLGSGKLTINFLELTRSQLC